MEKILVAMSGGVDSSVAARLLCEAGYTCIGCTMRLYDNEDAGVSAGKTCCSLDDVEDARSVAHRLGMPYYVFNFTDDFRKTVMERFTQAYLCGQTPNPCIDCNRYMKFDRLYARALLLGCDGIATGHYARIRQKNGIYQLCKAKDPSKDQSYVLYHLTQEQLAHTLFPLGDYCKSDTRRIAEAGGFLNADKPDSQDICFVPDGDYAAFITRFTGQEPSPGDFVDQTGKRVGTHRGIIHYTVGQHRHLGLVADGKRYVCAIRPAENAVVVGEEKALYSRRVAVSDVNWISGQAPAGAIACKVKIRYRQPEQPATVTPRADGGADILFEQPQRAVTPGQSAVFYDGDQVLGGGTILAPVADGE